VGHDDLARVFERFWQVAAHARVKKAAVAACMLECSKDRGGFIQYRSVARSRAKVTVRRGVSPPQGASVGGGVIKAFLA